MTVTCPSCHTSYDLDVRRGAPRSYGPRSQSARFHGHCQDIAKQSGRHPEEVKEMLKWAAFRQGLWRGTEDLITGDKFPQSEAAASVEEESNILRLQQMLADSKGWWLTEYIDPKKPKLGTYRSVGGRSYEEMKSYVW